MQGSQEREPLAGQQPIPLIQILPDGRLAYVTLPAASLPSAPIQHFPAPQSAPQLPMPVSQNASEVKASRDRWGTVVKVMGILMLIIAVIGLVTRVGLAHKMKNKRHWTLWGISLGVYLLMLVVAFLGIRAGGKKTSRASLCYLRFLVFFAVVFVCALVAASMICIKMEKKAWKHGRGHWSDSSYDDMEDRPASQDDPHSTQEENTPPGTDYVDAQAPGNPSDLPPNQAAGPCGPSHSEGAMPSAPAYPSEGSAGQTTSASPPTQGAEPWVPSPPEGAIPPEPSDSYPDFDPMDERSKRPKHHDKGRNKYGDRDEHWTKEEIREGMMLGMFVLVLLTMGVCSSCVFCAMRLSKYARNYEALFPRDNPVPQFSYVQQHPMQPMQQMHQVEMPRYQPQVVQAVPLGQAGLYPNLAPVGSAVQYPRAS